jgi:hypothetical protein
MAVQSREVALLHLQSINASGTSSTIIIQPTYSACILYFQTGTPTGTLPVMDMYIQQGFRAAVAADNFDGKDLSATAPTIWDDYAHFPQVSGTASTQISVLRLAALTGTSASNTPTATFTVANNAALGASVVQAGPLGLWWRLKWVVGGTTPVFPTVSIIGQFVTSVG